VNNAGGQYPTPAEACSEKGWRAVEDLNLTSLFLLSQEVFLRSFQPNRSGVIVNVIADVWRGFPNMAHTGAARAGVDNLTKTLAIEWAQHGVRVLSVAPGTINSTGLNSCKNIQESL
jgi:NAD(P)-dependent dehydrogenase (short-subunit alcohol dehydrogenase family)